jgi:hypothetical protein
VTIVQVPVMQTLILRRTTYSDAGTVGYLYRGRIPVCYTLELPWRDNAPGISCIPPGSYRGEYEREGTEVDTEAPYQVRHLERSASGKYLDVYHVIDVPGRSGILIHRGNFAGDRTLGMRSDVLGCILPGRRIGRLPVVGGLQLAVIDSFGGLHDLHLVAERQPFHLEVIGDPPC